jgi:uncharacterized protein
MARATRTGTPGPKRSVHDRRGAPIDLAQIEPLLDRIIAQWDPEAIWLFGSRARGDARDWSDWDVFVIVGDDVADEAIDHVARWRLRKDSGVRADVFPCRAGEFREDAGTPNTLAHEVATAGVLIHER